MTEKGETNADSQQDYEALLQFLYMAPIGIAQASIDGEISLINPLCAQLLMPVAPGGEIDNLFAALGAIAPDLAHRVRSYLPRHGKICESLQLQVNAGVEGGKTGQILSLTLLKLDDRRLMAVLDDITQSVHRDRELRFSQAWIQTIQTGLFDVNYALISLDRDGMMQGWNPGIRHLTGFEAEDTTGMSYALFYPEGDIVRMRTRERLREADRTGWNLEEGWLRRTNGNRFWGSCLIAPVSAEGDQDPGRAYSLVIRDISDRREANEALRRSIWSDHLTGLANRRAFFDAANNAIQRCVRSDLPLSLAIFDADFFKAVNDTHGHAVGDAVLRHLAAGLTATFKSTDLVARIGGEEFVVLMPGNSLMEAKAMAERFRSHTVSNPVTVNGVLVPCTVSAGVASLGKEVSGIDELMRRADAALYMAKDAGRDQVVAWSEAVGSRDRIELNRALE